MPALVVRIIGIALLVILVMGLPSTVRSVLLPVSVVALIACLKDLVALRLDPPATGVKVVKNISVNRFSLIYAILIYLKVSQRFLAPKPVLG